MSAVTLVASKEMSARQHSEGQQTPGMTDNFLSIEIAGNLAPNMLTRVEITGLTDHGLVGAISDGMRSIA